MQQVAEIERMSRLKGFLSPQIAKLVLSTGDERLLESHRRDITVVFCDLRGFTAFAESAEPEEIMAVLQEYYCCLGESIDRFEGTLERFAGDGLMVIFNDPIPCPDPSVRAVRMAVEMRSRVAALAMKWRSYGHQLGFGIGIAAGHATLGSVGYEGRFHYSATGSVVNLGARLCAQAADGQILIDGKVQVAVECDRRHGAGRRPQLKRLSSAGARLQRARTYGVTGKANKSAQHQFLNSQCVPVRMSRTSSVAIRQNG